MSFLSTSMCTGLNVHVYTEKIQVTHGIGIRHTKMLFCGGVLKFFSPLRGANSKIRHCALSYFLAQHSKRQCKIFRCEPFEAEYPKR